MRSGTPDRAEIRHRRLTEAIRLLASLAWLVLALALFRQPLEVVLRPTVGSLGLDRLLQSATPGFVLQVTSEPPGGQLWVDGIDRGALPVVTNVACKEGQKVRIQVTQQGLSPWRREIGCREGQTLVVTARMTL